MSDPPSSLVIRPWSFVLRPWSFVLSPSLLAPGFVRLSRGSQHDGPTDEQQRTKDKGPRTGLQYGTRTVPWVPMPNPTVWKGTNRGYPPRHTNRPVATNTNTNTNTNTKSHVGKSTNRGYLLWDAT